MLATKNFLNLPRSQLNIFLVFLLGLLFHTPFAASPLNPTWTLLSPSLSPSPRESVAMAFDPLNQHVLLFGGQEKDNLSDETWIWDGKQWSQASPLQSPSARWGACLADGSAHNPLLLFGGADHHQLFNDTWIWNGSTWKELSPAQCPSPRKGASLASDPMNGQLVLFGGVGQVEIYNDTWIWNGNTWNQLSPVQSPSPRQGASLAFDPISGQVLLFGGIGHDGICHDTWIWNDSSWNLLSPSQSPSPRHGAALNFDPISGQLLLFGGTSHNGVCHDTWLWNGITWNELSPSQSPSSRQGTKTAFDQANKQLMLFGGENHQDTWVWNLPLPKVAPTSMHSADAEVSAELSNSLDSFKDQVLVAAPEQELGITLTKTSLDTSYSAVGEQIGYTYHIDNRGNEAALDLALTDDRIDVSSCISETLEPGGGEACNKLYIVTQADLDNGSITNTATLTGTYNTISFTITASHTISAIQSPSLSLTKTASTASVTTAGERVTYTYVVTNTGNVTINNIVINDDKILGITCPPTLLAPGASTTCTGTYTVTQGDINQGSITNTATALGTIVDTEREVISNQATATVSVLPAIAFTKIAFPTTYDSVGDVILYGYNFKNNSSSFVLGNITVNDDKAQVTCQFTFIPPGLSISCAASYTVTQADIDRGSITNTAFASGTINNDPVSSSQATVTVLAIQSPSLFLTKSASLSSFSTVGEIVTYSYIVTNTGNVTINNILISDDKVSGITCLLNSLAPGESTTCTGSYTVTQADINQGFITNNASATGTTLTGIPVTSNLASATVTTIQGPSLTLTKSAEPSSASTVGQIVTYSYIVTNNGNVTINNLAISDDKVSGITCLLASLAPGESTTCTGTYTITQADINEGFVTNIASARGMTLTGILVTSNLASATVTTIQGPSLLLSKSATPSSTSTVGQIVTYSYIVTNNGNVTIDNIVISDDKVSDITCLLASLAPGESTNCTGTYIITQADINQGFVTNIASARGMTLTGIPVTSNLASATVTTIQGPSLSLSKSAAPSFVGAIGQRVTYSYIVTNNGNFTINNIVISDDKVSDITCLLSSLAPGESTTCTGTYIITQADINQGFVTNIASATGTGLNSVSVTSNVASATVTVVQGPILSLTKSAVPSSVSTVGEIITYAYVVTNKGNVTLFNVTIDDDKVETVGCPMTTLAPGESVTCQGTYVVTKADIKQCCITNTAVATGTTFNGNLVSSLPVSATVCVTLAPEILPPIHLKGCQKANRFATQTDYINILTWDAPHQGEAPVAYQIYLNRRLKGLVAEVSADQPLVFRHHHRKKGQTDIYYIVSVDRFGNTSVPATIKVGRHQ